MGSEYHRSSSVSWRTVRSTNYNNITITNVKICLTSKQRLGESVKISPQGSSTEWSFPKRSFERCTWSRESASIWDNPYSPTSAILSPPALVCSNDHAERIQLEKSSRRANNGYDPQQSYDATTQPTTTPAIGSEEMLWLSQGCTN